MTFSTVWTKHLKDKSHRDKFEEILAINCNNPIVIRLVEILRQDLRSLQDKRTKETFNESWAYEQAYLNGREEEIKKLLYLLEPITIKR